MHNFDLNEIKKFDKPSANWWDFQGEFKALHEINPLRLRFIQQTVNLAGKQVLDVGCGGGILAEAMAISGATVSGIDLSNTALEQAKQHAESNHLNIHYQQITAEALAEELPQKYDIVTCMELLEHVPDPQSIIRACSRLVKPEGFVFFATLNRNAKSFAYAIIAAEYLLNLLPKGTHEYEKFIKPSELNHWSEAEGLHIKSMTGMSYNPIKQLYYLTPNVSVNYIACFQKC